MVKNSKGITELFVLIILALVFTGGIGYWAYKTGQIELTPSSSSTPTPDTTNQIPDGSLANWKTYTNDVVGFEVKHPSYFYIKTESRNQKLVVVLSDKPNFDEDEFALTITFESLKEAKFSASSDIQILEILEKVGFADIKQKFANFPTANFLGDPPWGYYQIAIPQMSLNKDGVLITVRIHRADELIVSEGGTNGQKALVAKQILSTFKFLD